MSDYIPIDCNFYDRIESWAVQSKPVEIQFLNEEGQPKTVSTRILDTLVTEGEEFVLLENPSLKLRMDRLVSVDGHDVPNGPSCQL